VPTRRFLFVVAAVAALLLSASGGDDQPREGSSRLTTTAPEKTTTTAGMQDTRPTTSTIPGPPPREIEVVGKALAFAPDAIEVQAGETFIIVFDNQDSGIQHNFHLTEPKSYKTPVKQGPAIDKLKIRLTKKGGPYTFICDVHPNMKGEITAK
jgi:plastocyanin